MNIPNPKTSGKPNKLGNESSLYLRQHANNPVDWHPWGEEALSKAREQNKPLIISIGYSACHWCHVMEHESFSDEEVADFMNRHFVNIKIDREERPELDQLYMDAVHLLNSHGGWPLNCFALPDGRPFWGATYFPKSQWLQILDQISSLFISEPETLEEQAQRIVSGINKLNIRIEPAIEDANDEFHLDKIFENLSIYFDTKLGGFFKAPKFPMPSVQRFLLHYYYASKDTTALDQVVLTLNQMAAGGIYDQVGGGFARYSTDKYWKVPHFEKMLYDNAQLITLYCEAYMVTKNERFREVAIESMQFLEREMGSPDRGFSSAIDADSPEGEGSYYTFSLEELQQLLGEDSGLLIRYWKAGTQGQWEGGKNILMAPADNQLFCLENEIENEILNSKLIKARSVLLNYRNHRPKPIADSKIITSWNAFVVQSYVNLYRITGEKSYLCSARTLADFILHHLVYDNVGLLHVPVDDHKIIPGFLDDYGALILALIVLHSADLEQKWLHRAKELAEQAIIQFYHQENGLFFYTGLNHKAAFAQRQEIHDNVIPSSNSMMMEGLFLLGLFFEHNTARDIANRAIKGMSREILSNPASFSNWARLLLMLKFSFYTLVITGEDTNKIHKELNSAFLPQTLLTGTTKESNLPLLRNRFKTNETLIYLCSGNECFPPFTSASEAIKILK